MDKQLQKLAYIEDPEIVRYLSSISTWKNKLQDAYATIKVNIDLLCINLMALHGDSFSMEASKLPFKTYLFRSKAGNLTIDDLKKGLNTPNKLMALAKQLGVENIG